MAKYFRLPEVQKYFGGMSKAWVYEQIQINGFPKPVKAGRASLWDIAAVETWAAEALKPRSAA